jgi:hypothetical protein
MTDSTCAKCGNHEFLAHPVELEQCERPLLFVQCSNCGCVVGVLENLKIGEMLENIEAKLTEIETSIL